MVCSINIVMWHFVKPVMCVKYDPSTFPEILILEKYLLLYVRESWDELQDLAKSRKHNLHKSEECYKVYKDLTDALGHIEVLKPQNNAVTFTTQ